MESSHANPVDLSDSRSPHSLGQRIVRSLWSAVWVVLFRPSPRPLHGWRRWLLRRFGARIGRGVHVYPSAWIWAPWNLTMADHSCLGPAVDCYSVGTIRVGAHAIVSQYAYLCAASHDHEHRNLPLTIHPIVIGDAAWVAAGAFVGPGVTVGDGAIVGARGVVVSDVEPWTIVAGNPARFIKKRELRDESDAPDPDESSASES